VIDVEIDEPPIEEVFMHFYGGTTEERGAEEKRSSEEERDAA
jgi:hypothetical protein